MNELGQRLLSVAVLRKILSKNKKKPPSLTDDGFFAYMVAGAGFEPATFGL
jgi:hypothetical protein